MGPQQQWLVVLNKNGFAQNNFVRTNMSQNNDEIHRNDGHNPAADVKSDFAAMPGPGFRLRSSLALST